MNPTGNQAVMGGGAGSALGVIVVLFLPKVSDITFDATEASTLTAAFGVVFSWLIRYLRYLLPKPRAGLLGVLLLVAFLPGCTGTGLVGAIAGGDLTDAVIARAAQFNDRALDDLLKAEAFLTEKAARLARAKCRFPFTALMRYARESEANRIAVEKDCGLAIEPVAATVGVPPGG